MECPLGKHGEEGNYGRVGWVAAFLTWSSKKNEPVTWCGRVHGHFTPHELLALCWNFGGSSSTPHMDHEHELAEEWHRKDVPPETVLLISLGALLGLGVCTQVVRQSTLPVVITLILMAVITLGSMVALQSSLPATLSHGRPAYQSP